MTNIHNDIDDRSKKELFFNRLNSKYKYHIFYKIVFPASGEYYFGIHSTNDIDTRYRGGGTLLKRKKQRHHFIFGIVESFNTRQEASIMEESIVTSGMINNPLCLNLRLGGDRTYSVTGKANIISKTKATTLQNHGYDSIFKSPKFRQIIEDTNIRKYGYKYPIGNQVYKDKLKSSVIKKYGVDNVMKVDSIKAKLRQTNLDRYGEPVYMNTKECKEKIRNECMLKYGVTAPNQRPDIKKKTKQSMLKKYGVENANNIQYVNDGISELGIHKDKLSLFITENTNFKIGQLPRLTITDGISKFKYIKAIEFDKYRADGWRIGRMFIDRYKFLLVLIGNNIIRISPEKFKQLCMVNPDVEYLSSINTSIKYRTKKSHRNMYMFFNNNLEINEAKFSDF